MNWTNFEACSRHAANTGHPSQISLATNETQIWFMNAECVVRRGTALGENGARAFVGPPWNIATTDTVVQMSPKRGLAEALEGSG
jgi:hypothetical protein